MNPLVGGVGLNVLEFMWLTVYSRLKAMFFGHLLAVGAGWKAWLSKTLERTALSRIQYLL